MAEIKAFKVDDSERLIKELKYVIESCNVNLLIGSGFSYGILDTLGNFEVYLEKIQTKKDEDYKLLEAILLNNFFKKCISPIADVEEIENKLSHQVKFVSVLNEILRRRNSSIHLKQMNIFTTNYDPILEMALEYKRIEYNDGFAGRLHPYFLTSNYNKIYKKQAIFSNKASEITVFNLLKIHGSLTWKYIDDESDMEYQDFSRKIKEFDISQKEIFGIDYDDLFNQMCVLKNEDITDEKIQEFKDSAKTILGDKDLSTFKNYIETYKRTFNIVNPTKEKFKITLFNKIYHELLRIYSNELEKENTVLFTFGFSFADEHIEDITKRALNNPTLQMYIFAYDNKAARSFEEKFKDFYNVKIITINEDEQELLGDIIHTEKMVQVIEESHKEEIAVTVEEINNNTQKRDVIDLETLNELLSKIYKGFN